MLKLDNVSIARDTKNLIENINLAVYKKTIIGIIGNNGCGKTSLFKAICGGIDVSHGEITLNKGTVISSLEQEVPALSISALHYTISGHDRLYQIFENLSHAEQIQDYDIVTQCHNDLYEIDGYSAQAKATKILIGLGFSQDEIEEPVKDFSGGWRMRLNLAKCLFSPSQLLLLDEPTNHLDMEAIIWLERYLKLYPDVVLMVSHDRDFLDRTVSHIAHIEHQQMKLYTGNYSSFEVERLQQLTLQGAQYKKQQAQIAHIKKFVERFGSKASKAKQAQSRVKSLEKMELIKPIYEGSPFKFEFMQPERMPDPMLTMNKVNLGYGDKVIIKQANITIRTTQRIGLLGINGAGKSTLIKAICGELEPLAGVIERPSSLKIGYFDQHQIDYLPLDESPLLLLRDLSAKHANGTSTEKQLIAYLASFGFSRGQSLSPLKKFSGGEKARVALSLIIWQKPNLLLLDEPTNHLDLEMRQALTFALQKYVGAMVLVSHDRYLMRTLVDELYLIIEGSLRRFEGSVEDYQAS